MKKILGLTVAAVLVMALVGGGTWAYFSDPETTPANVLTAGTLNLEVGAADPTTANITLSNRKPGDTGIADWPLKNNGSLPGYLDITFSGIVDDENGVNEPEDADADEDGTVGSPGSNGELAEVLSLLIYIDEDNSDNYTGGDFLVFQDYVKGGSANLTGQKVDDYSMAANYGSGGDKAFRIEWSIDGPSVGNKIQSDSTGFVVEFSLEQIAD